MHVFMYFLHLHVVLPFTPPPPLNHNGKGSIAWSIASQLGLELDQDSEGVEKG